MKTPCYSSGLPLEFDFAKPPSSPTRSREAADHPDVESPGTHYQVPVVSGASACTGPTDSRVLHRSPSPLLSIETSARGSESVIPTKAHKSGEGGFRSHPLHSRTQAPTRSQEQRQGRSARLPEDDGVPRTSVSAPRRKRARDRSAPSDDSYSAKHARLVSGVLLTQVTLRYDGLRKFVLHDDGFWREGDGTPLLARLDIGDDYKRLVLKIRYRGSEIQMLKWSERWGCFLGHDGSCFVEKDVVEQLIWGQDNHWPDLTADDYI